MGSEKRSMQSDRGSEKGAGHRRGRPATSQDTLLTAADALFARSQEPHKIAMADIAAAAGVGKATLFRSFGSRVDLLNALFDARLGSLMGSYETACAELGGAPAPVERAVVFMDRLLDFKLANAHLMRARESENTPLYEIGFYRSIHGLLAELFVKSNPRSTPEQAAYRIHVLLSGVRIDLLNELLTTQQVPLDQVRSAQAELVRATFTA